MTGHNRVEVEHTMDNPVKYEIYKGFDIRSSPSEVEQLRKWKVIINVPRSIGGEHGVIGEHIREEPLYDDQEKAHAAGLAWGRQIVDEQIKKLAAG